MGKWTKKITRKFSALVFALLTFAVVTYIKGYGFLIATLTVLRAKLDESIEMQLALAFLGAYILVEFVAYFSKVRHSHG
jgi:hypothetical protein